MTVSARMWFATFAALVFVSGALAGVLIDRAWDRPAVDGSAIARPDGRGGPATRGEGPPVERLVEDLNRALGLTEPQREAVRRILERRRPRLQALQAETRQRFIEEQDAIVGDVRAVLSAEQVTRLTALIAARPNVFGPGPGRGGPGPGARGPRRGGGE